MNDRIGELPVKIGAVQTWQVVDVLRLQAGGDGRLFGEIAIELWYIKDEVVRKYVEHRDTDQWR